MPHLYFAFFAFIFAPVKCMNTSLHVHHDPLTVLREIIDLSGIMAETARTNIKPSLHMLVAGSLLKDSPHIDHHWNNFLKNHSKDYTGLEIQQRKRKWIENVIRIHQHNEQARQGLQSYYLAVNPLADMGVREYNRKMVKLSHNNKAPKAGQKESALNKRSNDDLPEEINWVEKGFRTPYWDQADCGSCYAFSVAASAEGQYFRKTNELINLSAQQLVDCSVSMGNRGCNGGSLRNTLRYCIHSRGLMAEDSYPYKGKQHGCHFHAQERKVNITSYVILPEGDEDAIMRAVATVGPVACSINASPYTFQLYHKGIYDDESCSSRRVNHAMLIVGYTKDAWILKNWWGRDWGIDGYMYLRRGENRCAVARYAGYPVVDQSPWNSRGLVDLRIPLHYIKDSFACIGMFVDLTEPERQRFIKQAICHIPGYTGHCPTIKFRHGHTFGANTRAILEDLRDISPISKDPNYRYDDENSNLIRGTVKSKDIELEPMSLHALARRPYILGYTGYIPGLNFEYGSSFSHLADKSRTDFTTRLAKEQQRREKNRLDFINTKPYLTSIRGKDDVTDVLKHYSRFNKMPDLPVSPELPPIAGYTGHIPGLRGSENTLSQRYHYAAQTGLTLLKEAKNKRQSLNMAKDAVRDAISYSHVH